MVMDGVPGDRISTASQAMVRLAPMTAPMMHRVDVTQHTFAVPKRLLWDNWENYITNTKVDDALPAHPYYEYNNISNYTELLDYMGIPPRSSNTVRRIDPMALAAYQFIWNEYYRDQNLQTEALYKLQDGAQTSDTTNDLQQIRRRAWEHDYFTSALPFAQKGDAVEIPIAGDVTLKAGNAPMILRESSTGTEIGAGVVTSRSGIGVGNLYGDTSGSDPDAVIDPNGRLEVSNANTTINDLRKAYALQRFLEKMARYGSRFTEFLRGVFNVQSSDKRLQRPEYICGSKTPIVISEVLNTTGTTDAPQGAMAGHGISVGGSEFGHYFCEEHCIIITIMSVMPKPAYQQGIPKMFLKVNDPFEHFFPDFDHIGEQEIEIQELYVDAADPKETFGYTPRYCEYKFAGNRVAGDFRTTLDFWHMGRIFETQPALNSTFVQCDPTHRVFAVTDPAEHKLWCLIQNRVIANRPMSKYSTPTF